MGHLRNAQANGSVGKSLVRYDEILSQISYRPGLSGFPSAPLYRSQWVPVGNGFMISNHCFAVALPSL